MGLTASAIGSFVSANAGAITAVSAAAGAVGTAYSTIEGNKARKDQADANKALLAPKAKLANAIDPNSTRKANTDAALAGIPGTLLTGAAGISPNSLNTGKTLLGG